MSIKQLQKIAENAMRQTRAFQYDLLYMYRNQTYDPSTDSLGNNALDYNWKVKGFVTTITKKQQDREGVATAEAKFTIKLQDLYEQEKEYIRANNLGDIPERQYINMVDYIAVLSSDMIGNGRVYRIQEVQVYPGIVVVNGIATDGQDQAIWRVSQENNIPIASDSNQNVSSPFGDKFL